MLICPLCALRDPGQRGVMLVLGCRDWQREALKAEVQRLYTERRCSDFTCMAPLAQNMMVCMQSK
jgi:hypothetical protein